VAASLLARLRGQPAGAVERLASAVLARVGVLALLALCLGCAGTQQGTPGAETAPGPWTRDFVPPAPAATERIRLLPLGPKYNDAEFAAILSSADHLRSTVFDAWPPPDFDLAQNRRDLVRHESEFGDRAAYAYAVLAAKGDQYLGAVFLKPARATEKDRHAVQFTYWVVAREIPRGIDEHLFATTMDWLRRDWPFAQIYVPLRVENRRAASLARAAGMVEGPPPSFGVRLFASAP